MPSNMLAEWCKRELDEVSSFAMYTGCMTSPTRRSETARLDKRLVDGERSEGVLKIADQIKAFAMTDMSINKASREQFMTRKVSMMSPRRMSSKISAQLNEDFRIWIACVFCSSGTTTHQCGRPTYSNWSVASNLIYIFYYLFSLDNRCKQ